MRYIKESFSKALRVDFIRFCIVGGFGFCINLLILTVLHKTFNVPIFIAQFFGAEVALFGNFLLHHYWTYTNRKVTKRKRNLFVQFHIVSWPAIIGSTLMVGFLVSFAHVGSTEALIASSLTALFWNFTWSKFVIWRDVSDKEVVEKA